MKQLLTILMLAICTAVSYNAEAQARRGANLHTDLTGIDTLDDATADTIYLRVQGPKHSIVFMTNVLKISGTVAGTIVLAGTIDTATSTSTKWVTLETDSLTNASGIHHQALTSNAWGWYRLIRTTTGTQSSSHQTFVRYVESE